MVSEALDGRIASEKCLILRTVLRLIARMNGDRDWNYNAMDWKQRFQRYRLGTKLKRMKMCSGQFPDICYVPGGFANHVRYLGMNRISATLC